MMLKISKIRENLDVLELETEEVEIEDYFERILILDKLEKSNKQSELGQVLSHEDLKKEVLEWFK